MKFSLGSIDLDKPSSLLISLSPDAWGWKVLFLSGEDGKPERRWKERKPYLNNISEVFEEDGKTHPQSLYSEEINDL